MDRDTELLKIQVYADACHSKFTIVASCLLSLAVAGIVAFMVLFLQKDIDLTVYYGIVFILEIAVA